MNENEIGKIIVDIAINIHKMLGPGLLESVYESIMIYELKQVGLNVEHQVDIPIIYKDVRLDKGFRADLVIENKVIVELKSIESVNNAHKKQVLTYLKLTNFKLGFLLNFGEPLMKKGIFRIINGYIS